MWYQGIILAYDWSKKDKSGINIYGSLCHLIVQDTLSMLARKAWNIHPCYHPAWECPKPAGTLSMFESQPDTIYYWRDTCIKRCDDVNSHEKRSGFCDRSNWAVKVLLKSKIKEGTSLNSAKKTFWWRWHEAFSLWFSAPSTHLECKFYPWIILNIFIVTAVLSKIC